MAAFSDHWVGWRRIGVMVLAAAWLIGVASAAEPRVEKNVTYGEAGGEELLLDVYRPGEDAPDGAKRPAVLLIHGGGWAGGNRTAGSMVEIANALARAGYVAFSIDYRLVKDSPDGKAILNRYPAAIDDCRRAVRWVRRHADEYGIDAAKLGACGDSAGGHLVSLLGTTDGAEDPGPELAAFPGRVQAVVDIFGPVDLTRDFSKYRFFDGTVQDIIDRFLGKGNTVAQREGSPVLHIDGRTAAFLIFHGTEDPLVPIAQSRDFDAALRKAGRESELVEFPGEGHGFKDESRKVLIEKTIAFFDRHLRKGGGGNGGGEDAGPPRAGVQAQPAPDWGALFKMHYQNRVKLFAEQNQVFRNVVLVGDSITEGFDVGSYFPGRRVLNRGIGADVIGNALPGDDPRGVLRRLDASVFDCAATDVFLLIGINDLNSGRTPDVMEEGYRELLGRLKNEAPRVRVHVQSVLPTRGDHARRNPAVRDVNARLKRLAGEFGFDYIDLHSLMADEKGELKAEFTDDGLHLTPPAYAVWRGEVERVLGWE